MNNFVEKALLAAIQAATRANDEVLVGLLEEAKAEVSHYNEKLNNAYAEIDQMRVALEPFAKAANEIERHTNALPVGHHAKGPEGWAKASPWEDLRRAREAYEGTR